MSSTHKVTIQSPSPPVAEKALRKEEKTIPLDDGLVMDMYNMTYEKLQKKIVQERRKHFPNDLASPAFIKERVIVTYTRINPNSISTINFSLTSVAK